MFRILNVLAIMGRLGLAIRGFDAVILVSPTQKVLKMKVFLKMAWASQVGRIKSFLD